MSERSKPLYRGIHRLVIVLLVSSIGLLSCDIFSSVKDDPSDPDRDNPRDPQSENAEPPIANIVSHDTTQRIELQNHSLTISWEPDTSGVTENVEYQYRLAQIGEQIDQKDWRPSEWMSDTSIEFTYLNEAFDGGNFVFQLKARSQDDTTLVQSDPTELTFSVNAISDRGIVFQPRKIQSDGSGSYSTELWLDEIKTTDTLTVVQAEIEFPNNQVDVNNIEIYTGSQSLLSDSGGDITDMVSIDQNTGRISINIGVLGGSPEQIEGSGRVGKITFSPAGSDVASSEIAMHSDSKFFNAEGDVLEISNEDLDSGIFQGDANQN